MPETVEATDAQIAIKSWRWQLVHTNDRARLFDRCPHHDKPSRRLCLRQRLVTSAMPCVRFPTAWAFQPLVMAEIIEIRRPPGSAIRSLGPLLTGRTLFLLETRWQAWPKPNQMQVRVLTSTEYSIKYFYTRKGKPMQDTATINPLLLRANLGKYPTGVSVITSADESGRPVGGMTAGTFTSVSLDPPLVAFLPAKSSSSWPLIQETGRFCINVLSAEQGELCKAFSVSGGDKFAGVNWHRSPLGLPIMDGVVLWVECSLRDAIDAGDHVIALGEVLNMGAGQGAEPLVFHGGKFHKLQPIGHAEVKREERGSENRYADH